VLAGGGVASSFNPGPGPRGDGDGNTSYRGHGFEFGQGGAVPNWVYVVLAIVALIIVLLVVIGIAAIFVRYVTRVSLIHMVDRYEDQGEELGFWSALRLGWSRSAWRLFLLNLLFRGPLAVLMLLLILPMVGLAIAAFSTGKGAPILLGVVLVLMIIPVVMMGALIGALIRPVLEILGRAVVIEGLGSGKGFGAGFT